MLIVILECIVIQIPDEYHQKTTYLNEHAHQVNTLILGSSHSFYGLDPAYFSSNSFNASHVSQTLPYDLEILKQYEPKFDKLQTIILPISYFSYFDQIEASPEAWRTKEYLLNYGILPSQSWLDYLELLNINFKVNFLSLISHFILKNEGHTCSELGWGNSYLSSQSKDLASTGKQAAQRHFAKDKLALDKNIHALEQIVALCAEKNIKLILFMPPGYQTYRSHLDQQQLQYTIDHTVNVAQVNKHCTFVNLLDDPAFKAEHFYDGDHLNEKGAKLLSLRMNGLVN